MHMLRLYMVIFHCSALKASKIAQPMGLANTNVNVFLSWLAAACMHLLDFLFVSLYDIFFGIRINTTWTLFVKSGIIVVYYSALFKASSRCPTLYSWWFFAFVAYGSIYPTAVASCSLYCSFWPHWWVRYVVCLDNINIAELYASRCFFL